MIDKLFDLELYNFELDDNKIARFPLNKREESKLLYVNKKNKTIREFKFNDSIELIPNNSLILRNSTRVLPARLYLNKKTGATIELLLINPILPNNYPENLKSNEPVIWECMFGGRIKNTKLITTSKNDLMLNAEIISKNENIINVEFSWNRKVSFSEIINSFGNIPIPPYLKRQSEDLDKIRYQTVYAKNDGSVASPTAGLHFTDNIFQNIRNKNCEIIDLTLHVGIGTFLPITNNNILNHSMHNEYIEITKNNLELLFENLKNKNKIIAIGTTSVRNIESVYWWALKNYINKTELTNIELYQNDAYQLPNNYTATEVFEYLLNYMNNNDISKISGTTHLFITPHYKFKVINGMFTNFHLPKSTLVILVATFLGNQLWQNTYKYALDNNFRFLSYGDSSLLIDE